MIWDTLIDFSKYIPNQKCILIYSITAPSLLFNVGYYDFFEVFNRFINIAQIFFICTKAKPIWECDDWAGL